MGPDALKTGMGIVMLGRVWATPAYGPRGSRCIGGMISSQASIRNEGTWFGVSRGIRKWRTPRGRTPIPETGTEQLVVALKWL